MYSQATLDEIRNRCDIVEVIGHYVHLKKSGISYSGLCPFHGEKTPSFNVNPQKQIYRCFGACHQGGNVFTFLMAIEGVTFPEAVKRLARKVGVELEEEKFFRPQAAAPVAPQQKRALEALEWAAKYFHYLLKEDEQYAFARKYVEGRGLTQKSIDRFRMGVSPRGWNTLLGHMVKRGFTLEELVFAGLVTPKEDSPQKGYDRFRGRLMFPILDKEGMVVGFGARALAEEDQPKYLNSSDSPIFSKSKILYGLYENQREIRLKAETLVVEGYMDVVGLSEAGVANAVAPMGTALTEEHCAMIKSFTQKVITVFDPDKAGIDAWHRSVHLFLQNGILARDLTLPGGLDPDEYVKENSAEKFYELCAHAPQQITKYLKEIAGQGALTDEQKSKYLQQLAPILIASKRLPDRGVFLWDDTSRVLNVSIDALKRLTEETCSRAPRPGTTPGAPPSPTRKAPTLVSGLARNFPREWEFFNACLEHPEEFLSYPTEEWIGFLKSPAIETVLKDLRLCTSVDAFNAQLEKMMHTEAHPEILAAVAAALMPAPVDSSAEAKVPFEPVAARIRQRRLEAEMHAIAKQIHLSQRMGDSESQLNLLKKLKDLRAAIGALTPVPKT